MKLERGRAVLSSRTDGGAVPAVSVVVPIYNEEENVALLHQRLTEALGALGRSYEIVYVDDGSRDRSFARLCDAAATDRQVRIVRFRRNFGQTAALQAGIEESRGDGASTIELQIIEPGQIVRVFHF